MGITTVIASSSDQLTRIADDLRLLEQRLITLARGDGDVLWGALGHLEQALNVLRKEAAYDQAAQWEAVQKRAFVQPMFDAVEAGLRALPSINTWAEPQTPGSSTLLTGEVDPATGAVTPRVGAIPFAPQVPAGVFDPDSRKETQVVLPSEPVQVPLAEADQQEAVLPITADQLPPHALQGFADLMERVRGEIDAERGGAGGNDGQTAVQGGGPGAADPAQEEAAASSGQAKPDDAPAGDAAATGAATADTAADRSTGAEDDGGGGEAGWRWHGGGFASRGGGPYRD